MGSLGRGREKQTGEPGPLEGQGWQSACVWCAPGSPSRGQGLYLAGAA